MIVQMKKIFMIVLQKDVEASLEQLREFGAVHVENQEVPTGEKISLLSEDERIFEKAVNVLYQNKDNVKQVKLDAGWKDKAFEINELVKEIDILEEDCLKREMIIDEFLPWGNFDPKDIDEIKKQGVYVKLCELPLKEKNKVPEGVVLKEIFSVGKELRCLAISKEDIKLPFTVIDLPQYSLKELEQFQKNDKEKIEFNKKKINDNVKYFDALSEKLAQIKDELRFEQVISGMKREEKLSLLKGFCPKDVCRALEEKAKNQKWGLLIEDVTEKDQVPTLLKNPKWVKILEPLMSLINILPGYKELDISPVFLLFFSFFVGMIIGDAGYGIVIAGLFAFLHKAKGDKIKDKRIFYLIYLMCGFTVFWGILTGIFFGSGIIKPLIPWLTDTRNLQVFCFLVGAIHLTVAHLWRIILFFPSLVFLSELGWLFLIWVMFFAAKVLVLGMEFPKIAFMLLYSGLFFVIFFSAPNKNPLKAAGPGLGKLALNFVNSFTDVVSYIRLFAVGLATVAVADAANQMNIFWILFLHTLNIVLAAMAILVHGLRLNVLEFSSHIGLEWSGTKYEPFKKNKKVNYQEN